MFLMTSFGMPTWGDADTDTGGASLVTLAVGTLLAAVTVDDDDAPNGGGGGGKTS